MTLDDARKELRGLAGYDGMIPVHQAAFDKALTFLEDSLLGSVEEELEGAPTYEGAVRDACAAIAKIRDERPGA